MEFKNNNLFDVIVIGGGASGMVAAICSKIKNPNIKVAIVESGKTLGKKLLSTGNGRCNLTNKNISYNNYHCDDKNFINKIINKYNYKQINEFFYNLGLLTSCDNDGRVYPFSFSAKTVLNVLKNALERLNVKIFTQFKINDINFNNNFFSLYSSDKKIQSKKIILACGGSAAPHTGSDGSGFELVKKLGFKINKPMPALVKIKSNNKFLNVLNGVRVNAKVSFVSNGKILGEEYGQIQFLKDALSGICVFNLSRLNNLKNCGDKYLTLNLMPKFKHDQIFKILKNNQNINKTASTEKLLTGIFEDKISKCLIDCAGISSKKMCDKLDAKDLNNLINIIENFKFEISDNFSFKEAQITQGGVKLNQINPKNMQAKFNNKIAICGELLDIIGDCGGYNLHLAFASAIIAAENLKI